MQAQSSIVDRGAFINGRAVEEFEESFADFCGRRACVGVASGLDALKLALIALGIEKSAGVLVPAMTFIATFEAVVQAGGVPIPVDVSADDCAMNVDAATAAVDHHTAALLPVHLYGQMADMVALGKLARAKNLFMIEDACQAHGARRDGVAAGAASDAGGFSFYPSKNLGAWGDAGALVTDRLELAATVRALREHGQSEHYYHSHVGFTSRLDALQAVVLSEKLQHLARWNASRAKAAAHYSELLHGVGDLRLPCVVERSEHVWHLFTIRTRNPSALSEFLGQRGIASGRHYPQPPHLSQAFQYLGHRPGAFPVAESIASETISLPLFPGITEAQLDSVVDGIQAYFADGRRSS